MTDRAFSWAQPFLDALDTDQPTPPYMQSLAVFITALRETFGEVNEQLHIETNLLNLRQSKGVTVEYISNFCRLAVKKQFDEPALLDIIRNGLSEEVKGAHTIRVVPTKLWSSVSCCIELHNLIRDRTMHRK
ncbi:hypothetical protein RMATCC62417_13629 [Rhizopus microsporus]|nr:hypothetical protein RMATCC62417_13629 [Rhizopus microsporus]